VSERHLLGLVGAGIRESLSPALHERAADRLGLRCLYQTIDLSERGLGAQAVGDVLAAAQQRSAGLVLAVFEGAARDPGLAGLAEQMTAQRAATAWWIVDQLVRKAPLRRDCTTQEAVDTLWILMDPAVFDRLVRRRSWTPRQYERWFAGSIARLLIADERGHPT
jgi:hypothetical protein